MVYISFKLLSDNRFLGFESHFFTVVKYRYIRYLSYLPINVSLYNRYASVSYIRVLGGKETES